MKNEQWFDLYYRDEELFSSEGFTKSVAKTLRIPGKEALLRPWDAFHLFRLAKSIPDGGAYLEIGSAHGGSLRLAHIAAASVKTKIKLIAIDPFVPYRAERRSIKWTKEHFIKNIIDIRNIILINAPSEITYFLLKNNVIDLLFIDGPMSFKQTKSDIERYYPKVKPGGVMLGHGFRKKYPGVVQAVKSVFQGHYIVPENSGMWMVEKDGDSHES